MPTSVDDTGVVITMLGDQKLCVNRRCIKSTGGDKDLVRSVRTKSYSTTAAYSGGVNTPETIMAERVQNTKRKSGKLQKDAQWEAAETQECSTKGPNSPDAVL